MLVLGEQRIGMGKGNYHKESKGTSHDIEVFTTSLITSSQIVQKNP